MNLLYDIPTFGIKSEPRLSRSGTFPLAHARGSDS